MFETIVWATDGSETADRGEPYVKQLAAKFGAKVIVVHSEEFLLGPRAGGDPLHADEEELQSKIKRQVEELTNAGVEASWKLVGGPSLVGAAHMVADVAREADADLIVVGTRGHTPLTGLLVSAVAQRLLHIAPCAVLAVPPVRQPSKAEGAPATATSAADGSISEARAPPAASSSPTVAVRVSRADPRAAALAPPTVRSAFARALPFPALADVPLATAPVTRLQPFLASAAFGELHRRAAGTASLLAGRRVWAVSSAASGGGVAELSRTLLPYWRGCGVDARWEVVRGTSEFFCVTKRLHHWLHGSRGDGGDLGAPELALFDGVSEAHARALVRRVRPGDVVLLQDPQTAPLTGALNDAGAKVVWRCHVGADCPNTRVHRVWEILLPRLEGADAVVFTRPSFVPPELHGARTRCIAPAIDPGGTKNAALDPHMAAELACGMGIVDGGPAVPGWIGKPDVVRDGSAPRLGVDPIVLSLCRWDRLKDPVGILDAFSDSVAGHTDAHLLLAGPAVGGVEDDPESEDVFAGVVARWEHLPFELRRRVHLVCLPLVDAERNAAMVNAMQHVADVVVKKSRAEGFGLGVTEAMWKRRPVVATAVGGQGDQIEHRRTGLLVDDPDDLEGFGAAVVELLRHRRFAARLGRAGRESVRARFLPDHHFIAWSRVFESVLGED